MNDDNMNFLQNDDFILWQLTGDQELETYWTTYVADNPSTRDELDVAIRKFSNVRLTKGLLSDSELVRLRQRIQVSASWQIRKQRMRKLIRYAAVACLISAFAGALYYNYTQKGKGISLQESILMSENLKEKKIYLITDTETASFTKDIVIQIDKNGKTIVRETDGGKLMVLETRKTKTNELVVPYGKRSRIELSDGTKVWLNSGSVLKFPTTFTGKTRNVYLAGEMYVEVAEDLKKPFFAHTSDFQVKVYGTRFNISAYRDSQSQSVVLVEGSVGVKTESEKETFLVPNDMLVYHDKHWDKKEVDVREYVSWKDGYLLLNRTPIDRVLQRMERYYNLSFDIQNTVDIVSKTCTGKIYLSDNPDDVMSAISLLYSIQYTREENIIYIHTNP
jgi:hypothetical protein